MSEAPAQTPTRKRSKWVAAVADYGGLAAFALTFLITRNLVTATWGLVAGSAASLIIAFAMERRIAPMPLITGGFALVFGALTLIFHDPTFIKMKPTFVYVALAIALVLGMVLKKNPVKTLLGAAVHLPDEAWRTLTWRYAGLFAGLAVINEIVWRTQSDSFWVSFKVFGLPILVFLFTAAQFPLFLRHAPPDEPEEDPAEPVNVLGAPASTAVTVQRTHTVQTTEPRQTTETVQTVVTSQPTSGAKPENP